MVKKSKTEIKKDFEIFSNRVAKLEALKQELKALNVKGFETDVEIIKAKLKDINAIPEVEKEIKSLRAKIEAKKDKKIKAESREHEELHKDTERLRRKIAQLEKLIAKKRKVSGKRQLSKKEVEFVKDIPVLEEKLHSVRRDFYKHVSAPRVKIDAGVGLLVDTKFDDFVNAIKAELTERLKEKEMVMDNQLKSDLDAREKFFAKKYRDLVEEFHKRYKKKVHDELAREVRKNFNEQLNNKLETEKGRVIQYLIEENKKRLQVEKSALTNQFKEERQKARQKADHLIEEKKKKLQVESRELTKELKEEIQKADEVKSRELAKKMKEEIQKADEVKVNREMRKREAQIRKELEKEYNEKVRLEMKKRAAELERKKALLEKHIVEHAKSLFK